MYKILRRSFNKILAWLWPKRRGAVPEKWWEKAHRSYREDLRKEFKSSMEANYARYLKYHTNCSWTYEPTVFYFPSGSSKLGIRAYIPDFRVAYGNIVFYVEVKGFMDEPSKEKIRLLKKYYPHISLQIVQKPEYDYIKRRYSSKTPHWE